MSSRNAKSSLVRLILSNLPKSMDNSLMKNSKMVRLFFLFICILSLPKIGFGQLEGVYNQRTFRGLCSSTFKLFPDSLYTHENGCEASSRFSIGRWKYLNDTILFSPFDKSNFTLIKNITQDLDSLKILRVVILDKNGVNITEKIGIVQLEEDTQYSLTLDSLGITRTDYIRNDGVLLISQFYKPFGDDAKIHIDRYNKIVITLNLTKELLQSSQSDWDKLNYKEYLITKDGFKANLPEWIFNSDIDKSQFFWIKQ